VIFLVDTNIVIHARDGAAPVLRKFAQHDGAIMLSALSLAELQRGLLQTTHQADLRRERLDVLLKRMPVVAFDAAAAQAYGRVIAQVGWTRGRDYDRLIAAHAISIGAVLVTDNTADFKSVPSLPLENWNRV
jgi:tRNA(fMet)-specific endonuclease VapC